MKKTFYILVASALFVLIDISYVSAQTYGRGTGFTSAPQTTEILRRETLNFEHLVLNDSASLKIKTSFLRGAVEHEVIMKGESTRVKFVFDNRKVLHIEIEGVGETSPEDIKNGEYIATLKPEKTTLYKINIHTKKVDGTTKVNYGLGNRRIIVVEPQKYVKVMQDIWWLKNSKSAKASEKLGKYLDKLAGGVPKM